MGAINNLYVEKEIESPLRGDYILFALEWMLNRSLAFGEILWFKKEMYLYLKKKIWRIKISIGFIIIILFCNYTS